MNDINGAFVIHYEKTLRDEFALSAMHRMLFDRNAFDNEMELAEEAYKIADAMLEARKKK